MSHDQKPARVRVVGASEPGRRRGDTAALGGRFASGPAPKPRAAAKPAGGIRAWVVILFLTGSLIGGIAQAYLVFR